MKIELIYPFFILTGLVIIAVLIYLRQLTKRAMRSILELIDMNAKLGYDIHQFIPRSPALLKKLKIDDFYCTIRYLNTTIEQPKISSKESIERTIQKDDYQITVGIVPLYGTGERHFLNTIVLEILMILIEMNILIKINVIHEALYKFSRLQTFLIHDVKNLAQFIGSLSYNVNHLESQEQKDRFLAYLKETLPVISRSGAKIISLLEMKKELNIDKSQPASIDLRALLENLSRYYNLPCTINGAAVISAIEHMVISIFDNLLKNIADKSIQEPDLNCMINIVQLGDLVKITVSDTGILKADRNRLFEPFYSTKKDGLGIGLFQSRNIAHAMKGDVRVLPDTLMTVFEVVLPVNVTA
jgi:signal transduction histidine kinase